MKKLFILLTLILISVSSVSAYFYQESCVKSIPYATHKGTPAMNDTLEAGMIVCIEIQQQGWIEGSWGQIQTTPDKGMLEALASAQGFTITSNNTTHQTETWGETGRAGTYHTWSHWRVNSTSGGGGGGSVRKL